MIDEDRLFAEVALLAFHFHWSLDEILGLDHGLRQRFVRELDQLLDVTPAEG